MNSNANGSPAMDVAQRNGTPPDHQDMIDERESSRAMNPAWVESRNELEDDKDSEGMGTGSGESSHGGGVQGDGSPNSARYSLLQFALYNFREAIDKYETHIKDMNGHGTLGTENNLSGLQTSSRLKFIESLRKKKKGKKGSADWTWSDLADLVKFSKSPLTGPLLRLPTELHKVAIECFASIMRYMGDHPMGRHQSEVDCVYSILMNLHKFPLLRDEAFVQLMKQTTSNKSPVPDSCLRGWRLLSIVAAYFDSSDNLRPTLLNYLETAAFDKRRAFHGTALVCLQNLRKTFKYAGRKNVPSIEEIAAISAGRNSKRQIYRLPGGAERVINTKSGTVVSDIIEEIGTMLGVTHHVELEEFSIYCIVEGDPYTMPLNRDEYILDVTTELIKSGHIFHLIFCRSVWFHPLRLDNHLYIEVIFNQVAPDYLEGLLLVIGGGTVGGSNSLSGEPEEAQVSGPLSSSEKLTQDLIDDIARVASLLHRAADMEQEPTKDEVKYLLPKPVLPMKDVKPAQWVEMVQTNWTDMSALTTSEAKAQCLDILAKWPLFGSCFFAVKRIQSDSPNHPDYILALNKEGIHFLDVLTHETMVKYPFSEVISTRKVRAEDGALFLDLKCGNLMVQKIMRIQTDQAHEISRLIRQYIEIKQRHATAKGHTNGS